MSIEQLRLSSIVEVVSGSVVPVKGTDYEIYSVPAFDSGVPEVLAGQDIKSSKRPVQENDVLLCKINPHINRVWRVGRASTMPQIASTEWFVLRCGGRVRADYLVYLLRCPSLRHIIVESVSGATGSHTRARLNEVLAVKIPVPPLAEQQRIVDKLDGIWHAIDATADANVTLAGLTQDVLDAALTERFGSLFERHPVSRLGDVVEIARGGSPRPISEFLTEDEDGVNWIKIGDASASRKYIHSTRERIKPSGVARSRMVYEGDFLLSNSMSFGRPYILRTTGCIHDGWLVLRDNAKKFNQDFLYYLLGSRLMYDEFSKRAQGSTVQNLNSSLVADVRVPVPPIDVQVEASGFAREIEESAHKLGEIYSSKSSKLETYRQSVLEAAFRSEL